MDPRSRSCNSRSTERGGGHIEGDPHPQVKRELGETNMELQNAKEKLSQALRVASRSTTSSPTPTMILPVQRKLANLADIPSTLSLPSEEQHSKCTYPLCFDFSQ